MQAVDKSRQEFEQELLFTQDPLTTDAERIQNIGWYHITLCHPGINRTEATITQHLFWPKVRDQITNYVHACPMCQKGKRKVKKYGHLPPKESEASPWNKMCIDLIGPYTICRKGNNDLICKCVTMIDLATGGSEVHQYDDKRSITVANIAEQEWFSRYMIIESN
jgi:Integrase zinc binding domain